MLHVYLQAVWFHSPSSAAVSLYWFQLHINQSSLSVNCWTGSSLGKLLASCCELLGWRVEAESQRKLLFQTFRVKELHVTQKAIWHAGRSHIYHSQRLFSSTVTTGHLGSVFVCVWVQFHGLRIKLDVLFPWWSQTEATKSALRGGHPLTEQHIIIKM